MIRQELQSQSGSQVLNEAVTIESGSVPVKFSAAKTAPFDWPENCTQGLSAQVQCPESRSPAMLGTPLTPVRAGIKNSQRLIETLISTPHTKINTVIVDREAEM